jgi:uncharacterized RDD family membrane protein YckC
MMNYPKADLGLRIKADLLDGLFALLFFLIPFILGSSLEQNWLLKVSILGWFLALLYTLFRDGIDGASWGKRKKGLKVIKIDNGEPCNFLGSFVRNIINFIPLVDLVDLVLIFVDKKGQRIGDKIMHLQVVEIDEISKKPYETEVTDKEVKEKIMVNNDSEEEVFLCDNCDGEICRSHKICPHCGMEIDWGDIT